MAKRKQPLSITLTDKTGIVWVRHLCRSCRKVVLWAVLGEETPMCCECERCRDEPLGVGSSERALLRLQSQERQYHGFRPTFES